MLRALVSKNLRQIGQLSQPSANLHLERDNFPAIPTSGQIAVPTEAELPRRAQVISVFFPAVSTLQSNIFEYY